MPRVASREKSVVPLGATYKPRPRGLPEKPAEMTWRDYLVLLLHIAAELEHSLMVEYLYAAYSLGGSSVPAVGTFKADGQKLPMAPQAKIAEWRDSILSIAREEMGHLLTVQNILCLVGGPVSFDRESFPWDSIYYPFPFRLEKISPASLACYVWAESPPIDRIDAELRRYSGVNYAYLHRVWKKMSAAVMPRITHPKLNAAPGAPAGDGEEVEAHAVGEIYEEILKLIADPQRIPESEFRAESYAWQSSWDDWGRSHAPIPRAPAPVPATAAPARSSHVLVLRAGSRTEAISALQAIAGQGEAPHLAPQKSRAASAGEPVDLNGESHFLRFLRVYIEMDLMKGAGWVRPVPDNPTTLPPEQAPPDTTPITEPTSRLWAGLFDLRYRMLLTYLTHSFHLARLPQPEWRDLRAGILHRIFGEMYNLKAVAGILVRLPLTPDAADPRRAGPPFSMPYSLDLPVEESARWRLHLGNLTSSTDIAHKLLEPAALEKSPPEAADYLRSLRALDGEFAGWIQNVLRAMPEDRA